MVRDAVSSNPSTFSFFFSMDGSIIQSDNNNNNKKRKEKIKIIPLTFFVVFASRSLRVKKIVFMLYDQVTHDLHNQRPKKKKEKINSKSRVYYL